MLFSWVALNDIPNCNQFYLVINIYIWFLFVEYYEYIYEK